MAFAEVELKRKPFDEKRAEDAAQMADKDDRKQPGSIGKTISLSPFELTKRRHTLGIHRFAVNGNKGTPLGSDSGYTTSSPPATNARPFGRSAATWPSLRHWGRRLSPE